MIGRRPGRVRGPVERRVEPGSGCWCAEGSGLREMAYGSSLEQENIPFTTHHSAYKDM